jgi:predicted phosphoadenosine phosphosulfate sulfurtransferase
MKIYQSKNVYEAALERIEWIYREFPRVVVAVSGGKDSTVIMHLALEVARRLDRLPVVVHFLDQEAEWRQTIEYMRVVKAMPDISMKWYQVEFKIFNSTSHTNDWLYCWKEGEEWIRPKEPDAVTENIYGTDRFADFLNMHTATEYPEEPCCIIGGVRAEESPQRANGLCNDETYKGITWGRLNNKKLLHYTFYPIYDWSYTDVWKYIAVNNFPYNKVYDLMYRKGIPTRRMRVSNLTHESAVHGLKDVQDIDRDTWEDIVQRLDSANAIKHLKNQSLEPPKTLPFMFESWHEYRDYLLDNLISDGEVKTKMQNRFALADKMLVGTEFEEDLYKMEILTILINDYYFTKLNNFCSSYDKINITRKRQHAQGKTGGRQWNQP